MFLHQTDGSSIKIWAGPDQVEPDTLRQLECTSRVMARKQFNQADLVEVVTTLKQLLCAKW